MADIIALKDLPDDIGPRFLPYEPSLRQRRDAKKYSKGSYIDDVKIYKTVNGEIQVKCVVYRSQLKRESPHKTTFAFKSVEKVLSESFCGCRAGVSGDCSHVLAVLMTLEDWILQGLKDVPDQPACTSMPQQWDKPRGAKIEAEPVTTMVIAKPGTINRKRKPLTANFDDNRIDHLQEQDIKHLRGLKNCGLSYLATLPDQTVQTDHGPQNVGSALAYHIPLMEPIEVPGQAHINCGDLDFPKVPEVTIEACIIDNVSKWKNLDVSADEAKQLERNTRDQSLNQNWHAERQKRLTASNFGRFLLRKAAVTQKFVDSVMKSKVFTSAATSYGSCNEKVAKNMYRKKTKNHVHECGFVVNPLFPFLGASPDGKVCDDGETGILEVKCPFSIRDWKLMDVLQSYEKRDTLCFEMTDWEIRLKHNHGYWFQVQGQLLVTGAKYCDFVIYTRQDINIQRILPDKDVMEQILNKLCLVYTKHIAK